MMDIRRGNTTITIQPGPPPLPQKQLSHHAYAAWDCFCDMIYARNEAVSLWQRIQKLLTAIEHRPDHPDADEAQRRITLFTNQFREWQLRFVRSESYAESYWKLLSIRERYAEDLDDQFGVEPEAESILGAWHRQLGETEGAPLQCKMDPTVLQFTSPSVARAYRRPQGS